MMTPGVARDRMTAIATSMDASRATTIAGAIPADARRVRMIEIATNTDDFRATTIEVATADARRARVTETVTNTDGSRAMTIAVDIPAGARRVRMIEIATNTDGSRATTIARDALGVARAAITTRTGRAGAGKAEDRTATHDRDPWHPSAAGKTVATGAGRRVTTTKTIVPLAQAVARAVAGTAIRKVTGRRHVEAGRSETTRGLRAVAGATTTMTGAVRLAAPVAKVAGSVTHADTQRQLAADGETAISCARCHWMSAHHPRGRDAPGVDLPPSKLMSLAKCAAYLRRRAG
jgi:hypothetical protein